MMRAVNTIRAEAPTGRGIRKEASALGMPLLCPRFLDFRTNLTAHAMDDVQIQALRGTGGAPWSTSLYQVL